MIKQTLIILTMLTAVGALTTPIVAVADVNVNKYVIADQASDDNASGNDFTDMSDNNSDSITDEGNDSSSSANSADNNQ